MRNDARPIGEGSPASPVGGDQPDDSRAHEAPRPIPSERPDSRDSVAHDRQSHQVHDDAEDDR